MKTLAIRLVEPTNCLVDGGIVTQISPILNKLERQRGGKRKRTRGEEQPMATLRRMHLRKSRTYLGF